VIVTFLKVGLEAGALGWVMMAKESSGQNEKSISWFPIFKSEIYLLGLWIGISTIN
jgi:hypothetical protein